MDMLISGYAIRQVEQAKLLHIEDFLLRISKTWHEWNNGPKSKIQSFISEKNVKWTEQFARKLDQN